jgi:hypothetical protein
MTRLSTPLLIALLWFAAGCRSYPTAYLDALAPPGSIAGGPRFAMLDHAPPIEQSLLPRNFALDVNDYIRRHGWRPAPAAPTLLNAPTPAVESAWVSQQVRDALTRRGYTEDPRHPDVLVGVISRFGPVYFIEPTRVEYQSHADTSPGNDLRRREEFRRKFGHYPREDEIGFEKTTVTAGGPQSMVGGALDVALFRAEPGGATGDLLWEGSLVALGADWSWREVLPLMAEQLMAEYPTPTNSPRVRALKPPKG